MDWVGTAEKPRTLWGGPGLLASEMLRDALVDTTARSSLSEAELSLRFGLHWGATLYMGRILTEGRSEVTALGDEMNEAARIEATYTDEALEALIRSKGLAAG